MDDFFAVKKDTDDFVKQMKQPRETVEAPPLAFLDEDDEAPGSDPIDNVEEGTAQHFDYDEEHEKTAEFVLMTMDQCFSFCASMYSGDSAEKYNRFSGKKRPTDYQLMVTAAMLKKYQAKLSLEWMFVTIVLMSFTPVGREAHKDRQKANARARKEAVERRAQELSGQIRR
ncbi:MAG: hypothetical protein AAFP08_11655 [Bacteroidota bacterium]